MGNEPTYRPIVTRKLISVIMSAGFYNKKSKKHGKYYREKDNQTIMVPRSKTLSSGLSNRICRDMKELHGFSDKEIKKLF